jgi:predicted metal-dependent hydrolase
VTNAVEAGSRPTDQSSELDARSELAAPENGRECGEVRFGNTVIEYTVLRSRRRRKTVEITLDPADGVLVAVPIATPSDQVRDVVAKRASWIIRRSAAPALTPRPKLFVSGESIPYLGRQIRLSVEPAQVRKAHAFFRHWRFGVVVPQDVQGQERRAAVRGALTRWYRRRAAERLSERTAHWSRLTGITPTAVHIRDQRQRWASCSANGALHFNWRIVMAPPALIDYVIIHELVHLRIRGHSSTFWAEVARLMPDCRLRRARLKEIGPWLEF